MGNLTRHLTWLLPLTVTGVFMAAGGIGYFEFSPPDKTCIKCHEIRRSKDNWAHSAHRNVSCKACHGGSVESINAMKDNAKRVFSHLTKAEHPDIRLSEEQILNMTAACGACHAQELAQWQGGLHAGDYARFFQDEHYNRLPQLNPQCFWCHGMFCQGTVTDLVREPAPGEPVVFHDPQMSAKAAVPCLACHNVHVQGAPFVRGTNTPNKSIAFYVRQERKHIAANELAIPCIIENGRTVQTSNDPRQRLCQQCHAPNAHGVAGSSSDRTPRGVHEGISCLACHNPHSGSVQNACAQCHPKFSTCGERDVMAMDTTYSSRTSKHNIHNMTCASCHPSPR